jgi:hypothetical protein
VTDPFDTVRLALRDATFYGDSLLQRTNARDALASIEAHIAQVERWLAEAQKDLLFVKGERDMMRKQALRADEWQDAAEAAERRANDLEQRMDDEIVAHGKTEERAEAAERIAHDHGEALIKAEACIEALEAALREIAEPDPETEGDWGATYDWHKTAIRRRDIARAALQPKEEAFS